MYEISDIIYIIKGHLPSAAFDKSLLKHLCRSPNAFLNSKTQKNSMQDRQKPFSESQQIAALETCHKFRYKSFLKPSLYSTWFTFIEFVFKLVVACPFWVAWVASCQAWSECHIINYLLTKLARAVLGNIGPRSFCTDLAALGPYCHDLGPIFPGTALALG